MENIELDFVNKVSSIELRGSRRRQDYLRQLGIVKDKTASLAQKSLTTSCKYSVNDSSPGGFWQFQFEHAKCVDESLTSKSACHLDKLDGPDNFRKNFICKLAYSKVWVPPVLRPPKHQTVIIFDWDDTLLCSSYLTSRGDSLPKHVEQNLRGIQQAATRLLERALQSGHTFIITNAMNGWVEYSAAKWAPGLLPILQKVRVISARSRYEAQFPGQIDKWKVEAFLGVQCELNSQVITNLVSIGDSNFEMDAVHVMAQKFDQALIKTVKLRERPSPAELRKQLELVLQKFEPIIQNARNLKISLELRQTGAGS